MNSMAVLAVAWKLDKMVISKMFLGLNAASRGFVAFFCLLVCVGGKRASKDYSFSCWLSYYQSIRHLGITIACWELSSFKQSC